MSQERLGEIERLLRVAEDELAYVQHQGQFLLGQIASLQREREGLLHSTIADRSAGYQAAPISNQSGEEAKIALFRSLFRGREDVYARRFESRKTGKSGYQPDCENEWLPDVCLKPKIKCSHCNQRRFIPLSDAVIRNHLLGRKPAEPEGKDFTIGIYPLLPDETCWFLAVDFDKSLWKEDAGAFRYTCSSHGVPASLERSRSGNGAHVWIFFSDQVPSPLARSLGSLLLTEATERRSEIAFLALPISWKGTLAQYAGRLNRLRQEKQHIAVYDYVDFVVPMLRRMFERRRRRYRQLGYEICGEPPRLRIDAVASGSIPKREGDDRRGSQGDDEKES